MLASPWSPRAVIIDAMFMIHTKPQSGEQKLHYIMASSIFARPFQEGCYPGTVHLVGNLKLHGFNHKQSEQAMQTLAVP